MLAPIPVNKTKNIRFEEYITVTASLKTFSGFANISQEWVLSTLPIIMPKAIMNCRAIIRDAC